MARASVGLTAARSQSFVSSETPWLSVGSLEMPGPPFDSEARKAVSRRFTGGAFSVRVARGALALRARALGSASPSIATTGAGRQVF
jgi:hypothetical protein